MLANPKTVLNDKYAKKEIKQQVIRADQLISYIKNIDAGVTDSYSDKDMEELANYFISQHKQNQVDYVEKYRKKEEVEGVVPIYDFFSKADRNRGIYWYAMPKASNYLTKGLPAIQILEDVLYLAKTIRILHSKGYAHRDIKPKNILLYRGRLCLTDFGLVCKQDDDIHITEVDEKIGPNVIRPPEFENAWALKDFDYSVSDVYLFAKTVWMLLKATSRGSTTDTAFGKYLST